MKKKKILSEKSSFERSALGVSVGGMTINTLLALGKLSAGLFSGSSALISDAIHSAADVFGNLVVLFGVKLSLREADEEHPYGHERLEPVSALALAVLLLFTGAVICCGAVNTLVSGAYRTKPKPGAAAVIAACLSIAVKEGMYRIVKSRAKKYASSAMLADAWHHRSDALASVCVLIGVVGSMFSVRWLDSAASIPVSFFILKAAFDIFKEALRKLVDHACEKELQQQICFCAVSHEKITGVKMLRTRRFGNRVCAELSVGADKDMSFEESYILSEEIRSDIEKLDESIKSVTVSLCPEGESVCVLEEGSVCVCD